MPFDKDYWSKLATDAGLPKETVEAIAGNEKVMGALANGYKRHDEFSREMDAGRKTQAEAEAAKQSAIQKYTENLQWYEQNKGLLTEGQRAGEYKKLIGAYEALHGPLNADPAANGYQNGANGNGTPANGANGQPKYLTAEELAASQRNFWTLLKQVDRAKEQYKKQFGEDMPTSMTDELEALAQKPENANRSVTDMFNEHISPRIDEKRTADIEARVKAAREEAYQQGFSKGRMNEPTADNPENISPFYATKPNGTTPAAPDEAAAMRNFIETLDEKRPSP